MQAPQIEPQTLREFLMLAGTVPGGNEFVKRISITSYVEYVKTLYEDLDQIYREMERNPQNHYEDEEDKITYFIASMLTQRGYRAECGLKSGGSVDLTVDGVKPDYRWIGEAKIYRTLENIRQGFLQLTTRYRPADLEKAKVGMLIYIQREDPLQLMLDWRNDLLKASLRGLTLANCIKRPSFAFYSTHTVEASGIATEIRHMALAISHKPKDKSALNSRKYGNKAPKSPVATSAKKPRAGGKATRKKAR